ncbi:hypothetical protein KJ855_04065 [Patescibacteria group bacterium]|nr:hypothetical protein [Patescibacteria group bacterium]
MVSSVHLMSGAAIASSTDNWLIIVFGSLILHFVLDIVPHWNPDPKKWPVWKYAASAVVDVALAVLIILWLAGWKISWQMVVAMLVSELPDILALIGYVFKVKVLESYNKWHANIQVHSFNFFGFASQVVALIIMGYIVYVNN